jgi:hypothetical protein
MILRFIGFVLTPLPDLLSWVQILVSSLAIASSTLLSGLTPVLPSYVYPLVVLVVLLIWAGLRLYRERDQSLSARVLFDTDVFMRQPPYVLKTVQKVGADGYVGEPQVRMEDSPQVIFVKVRNDPPLRKAEARVDDAEVGLDFYSLPSWELKVRSDALWLENDPPIAGKSLDTTRRRDLPANGRAHEIEVLVKHPGTGGCYASDPQLHLASDMRNERFALGDDEYAVAVRLSGQGLPVDVVKWLLLNNLPDSRIQVKVAPDEFEPKDS